MTASRATLAGLVIGLIGIGCVVAPAVVALCVPAVFLLVATVAVARCCCAAVVDPELRHRVERWAIAAFAAHLILGVTISSVPPLSRYLGGDAFQYDYAARGLAAHWLDGAPVPPGLQLGGKSGFTYLLAVLYVAFGPYGAVGLAVNAFFGASLVPLMADTSRRLFDEEAARRVPPLVLLPIGFLLWPSQLLREAGVLALMAVALNAATRLREQIRPGSLVAFAVAVGWLFAFRHYVALTMAGGLIVGLVIGRKASGGLGAGASAALLLAALVFGLGLGYGGVRTLQSTGLERAAVIRRGSAIEASSGFLEDADISTSQSAIEYLPLSTPRLLLGPFPWEVRGVRQLPALIDVGVVWALLPSLRRGLRTAHRRHPRVISFLLPPAAFLTVVLSLLVANYGTVVRSRLQVFLLLVPLIAVGLPKARRELSSVADSTVATLGSS